MLITLVNPPDSSGGKKIFFSLSVFFLLLSSHCLAGEWNLTGSLNQGRSEFCSVILDDGRVLVAGGHNSGVLSSCEIYDSNTSEWSTTDSMNYARMNFSLTKLTNGKILSTAGNGLNGVPSAIMSEIFNPETETWSDMATLNYARVDHRTILLQNNNVLVVGGDNSIHSYKSCEIYDAGTNEWTLTGFCFYQKVDHTLELLPNGRVMAIGGGNSGFQYCEIYDPDTELWIEIADLNEPRWDHTSHLLPNGNVMAIAGASGYGYNSSCEIYDFQTEEWSFTDSLEIGRTGHCSETLLNTKTLVMGGHSDQIGTSMTCEIYNYENNQWQMAASLIGTIVNNSSEILEDERVLVIGKYHCGTFTWNYQPTVSQPQTLSGLNEAIVGEILTFFVIATDPDNDSIAIRIDWGDNETSEWTELQPSGTTFELSHSWTEPGIYEVRAQAADQWFFLNELCHNSLSEWSEPYVITIIPGQSSDPSINPEISISIYPNPFSTSTTISFSCQVRHDNISAKIYNIKGQEIRILECINRVNAKTTRSFYSITWNGRDDNNQPVVSGIYFYKLMIGENEITSNKMLLLK